MDKLRINKNDLILGEPLRWDVFDEHGILLLGKGHVIRTEHQFTELIERGMYVEAKNLHARVVHAAARVQELPSIVRLLNQCNRQLEHLLFGLHLEENAQPRLLGIASTLVHATELNPDLALACIMLNDEAKSYTIQHAVNTAIVALLVARAMKKPPETVLLMVAAALTMNLGMLRQHNAFQSKSEALSENDKEVIRRHPQESVRLLQEAGVDNPEWLSCVLHHHESEDGSGYPFGKKGDECPQSSRIISLADLYCAAVTGRAYRKPQLPGAVLRSLFVAGRKTDLAPYFLQELGIYPPGSFVRLRNGELAVVTRKGKTPATPVVHAYIGPRGAPLSFPIQRDTARELHGIQQPVSPDCAPLTFTMQQIWGSEAAL